MLTALYGELGLVVSPTTLLIDAAQTIGHVPIDVQAAGIDLLAVPSSKHASVLFQERLRETTEPSR